MKIVNKKEYDAGFGTDGDILPNGIQDYGANIDLTAILDKEDGSVMLVQDLPYHSEEWRSSVYTNDSAPFIRMKAPELRRLCLVLSAMANILENDL